MVSPVCFSQREKVIVLVPTSSTSIRNSSSIVFVAQLKSFLKLFRSLTRSSDLQSNAGESSSTARKRGVSGDVPISSQRAAFWSMKTNPLSAGTRRGRRGFCQTLGEPVSKGQDLANYLV
jgi:hypothetical protein